MDIGKPGEWVKRRVAELRALARRISSATPESDTGRMRMLLALLFAAGLLGGLRIGESEIWVPPPLATLVLAALMLGVLNRHGTISLRRLLYSSRSAIDPYGLLMILAIVFASAQAFHVAIPAGFLSWLVYLPFLLLLVALNTRLIAADHARMLWTLVVILGAAFTVTLSFFHRVLPRESTRGCAGSSRGASHDTRPPGISRSAHWSCTRQPWPVWRG